MPIGLVDPGALHGSSVPGTGSRCLIVDDRGCLASGGVPVRNEEAVPAEWVGASSCRGCPLLGARHWYLGVQSWVPTANS